MTIKPLKNNIFVRLLPTKSDSELVIVGANPDQARTGEIVFCGDNLPVSVGDKIMFGKHCGIPTQHEGEELLMMTDMDILVVFD